MPDKRSPEWLSSNSLDRAKKKRRRQDLPPYGNNFYSTPQENRRRPYNSGYGQHQSGSGSENHTSRARHPLPSQSDYFEHKKKQRFSAQNSKSDGAVWSSWQQGDRRLKTAVGKPRKYDSRIKAGSNDKRLGEPGTCTYGDKCFNIKCKYSHPSGMNRKGILEKRIRYKVTAKGAGDMFVDQQKLVAPKKIQQRLKQINLGKDTKGYCNYLKLVPKHKRSRNYQEHPRTPDHTLAISNRNWLGQIRVWREALHKFDDVTFEDDELRKYPLSRKMNLILKARIGDLCPATGQNFDVVLGPQYLPATGDLTEHFIAAIKSDSLI